MAIKSSGKAQSSTRWISDVDANAHALSQDLYEVAGYLASLTITGLVVLPTDASGLRMKVNPRLQASCQGLHLCLR